MPWNWVKTELENANKIISELKAKETCLLKRIIHLEHSEENYKTTILSLKAKFESLLWYNKVLTTKLSSEKMINDEDEKELIECPPPSFVKILDFESLLDSDNALGRFNQILV